MIIFKREKEDGLEELIKANSSISALCPILAPSIALDDNVTSNENLSIAYLSAADSKDLYKIYSILVSVGWNLNDDVFTREEIWQARHTPQDKPFNLEHNPRVIIGHITKSCVVDESYKLIDDNTNFDDLPSKFHILTSAVLYRHKPSLDKDLTKETDELIASIAAGDWFVSMECLFPHFDYIISHANGKQEIIERNEDTCFLSKYLKVYKGTGSYNNAKIGRCLRNITFSGKGLVKVPGNPESYIFTKFDNLELENSSMSKTLEAVAGELVGVVSKEEYAAAQKEIADLRGRLDAAKEEDVKKKIEEANALASAKAKEVDDIKVELDNVKASKKELETTIASLTEKVKDISDKLEAANDVIAKANAEKITLNRVSILTEKGVEKNEAEKIVAAAANTSDEIFAMLVEAHAKLAEATSSKKLTETEKAKADEAKLESAKAEEVANASLAVENNAVDGELAIANLQKFLERFIDGGK